MVVGLCNSKVAFVAAKALEASSTTNPMTRPFETVANFMAAPFFFPESTSRNGWGGPTRDRARKTLCVFPRIAYNAAAGVVQTSHKLALPRWGFSHLGRQTECESIPRPRKMLDQSAGVTPAPALRPLLRDYAFD